MDGLETSQPQRRSRCDPVILLEAVCAAVDEIVSEQLNEVLHAPCFQRLEAAWRGVQFLTDSAQPTAEDAAPVIIRLLSVTWTELRNDLQYATEFYQSYLFRQIYDQAIGMPGGEPFGLLLGNFEIGLREAKDQHGGIATLRMIGDVAAAAFAPFVAQAHPSLLGLSSFADLHRQSESMTRADSPEMRQAGWVELRQSEEARFLGLTIPRVLSRPPHTDDKLDDAGFRFREDVSAGDSSAFCWASSIWALGAVAITTFMNCGWFAGMRGVNSGERGAGLVDGLPSVDFNTDAPGVAIRTPLDLSLTDALERQLAELGLICLCPDAIGGDVAFYTVPTLSKPRAFTSAEANSNAALSSMLPYMLCVSRFAHTLKVIARDQIGTATEHTDLKSTLDKWIARYVAEGPISSPKQRAKMPLSQASVELVPAAGDGKFNCVMRLQPHLQFENIDATMTLRTRLEPAGAS